MVDVGRKNTEKELARLEASLKKEYNKALAELKVKADSYFEKFKKQDAEMLKKLDAKQITHEDYRAWRQQKILVTERYNAMIDGMAMDLTHTDQIAARMIDRSLPYAYAENYNFAGYEICHGLNVNISFDLVDHNAVERLIRDNPDLLPKPRVDIPKDMQWNKKKLNSALTQGILQGDSMDGIAKRLRTVTDMSAAAAIRNARTMTTGAESAGKLNRYKEARDMGIDVNKVWIATLDGRTRDWHVELDGASVPLDEPFVNEYGEIDSPGDPGADPANVYNCRCRMISEIRGYSLDFSERAMGDDLNGMTYDEWKSQAEKRRDKRDAKRLEKGKPVYEKKNYRNFQKESNKIKPGSVQPKVERSWFDRIKDIQAQTGSDGIPTTDQIMQAGQIFSREIDRTLEPRYAELQKYKAAHEAAGGAEYQRITKELSEITSAPEYTDGNNIARHLMDPDESKYFKGMSRTEVNEFMRENYYSKRDELEALRHEIEQKPEFVGSMRALRKAERMAKGTVDENIDLLVEKLSKVREVGVGKSNLDAHLGFSRSPMKKVVKEAYSKYPRSWVERSANYSTLAPKKVNRGYYSHWRQEIAISGYSSESYKETAIHELGHRFERVVGGIKEQEKIFYERRTAGESLEWLGGCYAKDEKTRKDDFINPYMGKDYGGTVYELVSMGFQYAYTDPMRLAKDADMRNWIHGMLCLMP